MSQIHKHSIPANIADSCLINPEQYKAQYHQSVTDPDAFFIRTDVDSGLTLFQRRALEFTKDNEFTTENALSKATERYSLQIGDFREWFGSPGA